MTVVKRQAQSPAGVSSEVEVLKALKSLFEHHKALDEKVRERLRVTLDKVSTLENELSRANEELNKSRQMQLQQQQQIENLTFTNKLRADEASKAENTSNKAANGNETNEDKAKAEEANNARLRELQSVLDKQTSEMLSVRNRSAELNGKLKDYEDRIIKADKDVSQLKEENIKLSRDLKENMAQKEDQEERITTLEKRYLNAQRESTSLHDMNEKLERDVVNKEAQLRIAEEKINSLNEQIKMLTDAKGGKKNRLRKYLFSENGQNAPDENEEEESDEELDEEKKKILEEKIMRLEQQLEEKNSELSRARQREKMNEDHNQRLSATVDRLLAESNERLQLHLKERMTALEEKNTMTQELERIRKLLDETQLEKGKILQELSKMRIEVETLSSENNMQTSSTLSRIHANYMNQQASPVSSPMSEATMSTAKLVGQNESPAPSNEKHRNASGGSGSKQSPQAKSLKKFTDSNDVQQSYQVPGSSPNFNEHEEEVLENRRHLMNAEIEEYAAHLANESNPFDEIDHQLDQIISSTGAGPMSMPHHHISSHQTDPQTLAMMLQEQLDAINNEIRLIQEEKQSTDPIGDEVESQVGSIDSSINYLGHAMPEQMASFSGNYGVGLSPPQSGASTPKSAMMPLFMNSPQFYPSSRQQQQNSISMVDYSSYSQTPYGYSTMPIHER